MSDALVRTAFEKSALKDEKNEKKRRKRTKTDVKTLFSCLKLK